MIAWVLLAISVVALGGTIMHGRRKQRGNIMWRRVIVVWAIVVTVLLFAILPGVIGSRSTVVSNRDVIIVADLTLSVNAVDSRSGGEATRIDDMRVDIKRIAEDQLGASIGIMTFSDRTDLYLPLTTNSEDVQTAVDTLYTASSNQSISKTVKYQDVFKSVGEYLAAQHETDPTRERVVVFMSDFEIFKQQETDGDVTAAASAVTDNGASYVGLLYGSGEPTKMLNVGFDYIDGVFEPTYITQKSTVEGTKYLQDNYKTVFSTANPVLSEQIASRLGGRSIATRETQEFIPSIETAAGKSSSATSGNAQAQASKQQLVYILPAAIGVLWLFVIEVVKPSWAMKRLARGSLRNNKGGQS